MITSILRVFSPASSRRLLPQYLQLLFRSLARHDMFLIYERICFSCFFNASHVLQRDGKADTTIFKLPQAEAPPSSQSLTPKTKQAPKVKTTHHENHKPLTSSHHSSITSPSSYSPKLTQSSPKLLTSVLSLQPMSTQK